MRDFGPGGEPWIQVLWSGVAWRALWVSLALLSIACADDAPRTGGADGTGTGDAATGGPGDDDGVDETAADDDGPCSADGDCDDDNPCSVDTCEAGACTYEAQAKPTNECRPHIVVDSPERGATIEGAAGDTVTVTGSVTTGFGSIESLTLNDKPVAVGADGTFSVDFDPTVGGNTLIFDTEDASAFTRRRVQSFLWSTTFRKPAVAPSGISPQGLLINLDQQVIDDGDHSLPADDIATLLQLAVDNFDISQFLGGGGPLLSSAGYDVYLDGLTFESMGIALTGIDGGMHLVATVEDIEGPLTFDCTNPLCLAAGGDSSGGLTIAEVGVQADMMLGVSAEHTLSITLANVSTLIDPDDVDVYSNNAWTNILLSVVELFIIDDLAMQIADELTNQVYETLSPLLAEGLAGLNFSTIIDFPSLADPKSAIPVDLITDWSATDFHDGLTPPSPSPPQGGVVQLRGGGYVDEAVTDYDNLGIPDRAGCGAGGDLDLPRAADIEIGLTDDMLNQLLYAAWRGGLLQFPLPMSDAGAGIYEDLEVDISGYLAPTANDCNDEGRLLAHIGDLQIDASLTLQGNPIHFVAFSSLVVAVEISVVDGHIAISIPNVESMATELTVEEDDAIATEELLVSAVEAQLETQLIDALGTGGLGGIALPDIDVSATLGLPPGTAQVTIEVTDVTHEAGVTVMSGHL